jgi:hypothetical protein
VNEYGQKLKELLSKRIFLPSFLPPCFSSLSKQAT